MGTVLLGEEGLDFFALFGVVHLNGVVGTRCQEQLSSIVEVEGGH